MTIFLRIKMILKFFPKNNSLPKKKNSKINFSIFLRVVVMKDKKIKNIKRMINCTKERFLYKNNR